MDNSPENSPEEIRVESTVDWVEVADATALTSEAPLVVDWVGEPVTLFRIQEQIYGIQEFCPHQGAPLSTQGVLNPAKKEVVCSWHGWRYDLESGKSTNVPGFRAKVFEAKEDGERIWIRPNTGPQPVSRPTAATEKDKELLDRVVEIVEADIRPSVQMDGGDIEVVGIDEGVVKVRLHGACVSCSSSSITLYQGVQNILANRIPEIRGVEQVF